MTNTTKSNPCCAIRKLPSPRSTTIMATKFGPIWRSPCPLCSSFVHSVSHLSLSSRSRSMYSHTSKLARFALLSLFITFSSFAQEPAQMPPEMHHHHGDIPVVQPVYPRLGRAQENPGSPLFTLDQAQKLAAESNPTLRQAEAEIRAAKARQQQAGLYPNPTVGYAGDEIRGGSVGGGKQGFFLQQTIVTGGKLALARDILAQETKLAEVEAEE